MSFCRLITSLFSVLFTLSADAAESPAQHQANDIVSYADVMQWTFALIFVLAMFGLFIWLLRKIGNFSFEHKSQLAVLSSLSLGVREKLVLVKVGEKQLLLGVTPGRLEKLMELEGDDRLFQEQINAEEAEAGAFAKKLQQALKGIVDA